MRAAAFLLSHPLLVLLVAAAPAASCATAPRQPPAATSPRVKDSPAESAAAQRAATPRSLELEKDDERWGIEAARERRRAREREQAGQARPGVPASTTGVVEPARSN